MKKQKNKKSLFDVKAVYMARDLDSDREYGFNSEQRFLAMTEDLRKEGRLPWVRGVAKTSVSDDEEIERRAQTLALE